MFSSSVKIRFVVVDTITGNEVSRYFTFESQAQEAIPDIEESDRAVGCYEPNAYVVNKVEVI